jgi:hypothetical protein
MENDQRKDEKMRGDLRSWSDWKTSRVTDLDGKKFVVFVNAKASTDSGYEGYPGTLEYLDIYSFKTDEQEEFNTMVRDLAISGEMFSFHTLGPKGNFKIAVEVEEAK